MPLGRVATPGFVLLAARKASPSFLFLVATDLSALILRTESSLWKALNAFSRSASFIELPFPEAPRAFPTGMHPRREWYRLAGDECSRQSCSREHSSPSAERSSGRH